MYISLPAIVTDGEMGSIIRISPVGGETIAVPQGFGSSAAARPTVRGGR